MVINAGTWIAPLGPNAFRPSPIGTFAFSKLDQHRALMFGGRGSCGRMNEAFILDLEDRVSSQFSLCYSTSVVQCCSI